MSVSPGDVRPTAGLRQGAGQGSNVSGLAYGSSLRRTRAGGSKAGSRVSISPHHHHHTSTKARKQQTYEIQEGNRTGNKKISTKALLLRCGLEKYHRFFEKTQEAGFGVLDAYPKRTDGEIEMILAAVEREMQARFTPPHRVRLWKALRYQWFGSPENTRPFMTQPELPKLFLPKRDIKQMDSEKRLTEIDPDRQRQITRKVDPRKMPGGKTGHGKHLIQFEVYKRVPDDIYELRDLKECVREWQGRNPRKILRDDPREDVLRLRIRNLMERLGFGFRSLADERSKRKSAVSILVFLQLVLATMAILMLYVAIWRYKDAWNVRQVLMFQFVVSSKQFISCIVYIMAFGFAYAVAMRHGVDIRVLRLRRMYTVAEALLKAISEFRLETEDLRLHSFAKEVDFTLIKAEEAKQAKQLEETRTRKRATRNGVILENFEPDIEDVRPELDIAAITRDLQKSYKWLPAPQGGVKRQEPTTLRLQDRGFGMPAVRDGRQLDRMAAAGDRHLPVERPGGFVTAVEAQNQSPQLALEHEDWAARQGLGLAFEEAKVSHDSSFAAGRVSMAVRARQAQQRGRGSVQSIDNSPGIHGVWRGSVDQDTVAMIDQDEFPHTQYSANMGEDSDESLASEPDQQFAAVGPMPPRLPEPALSYDVGAAGSSQIPREAPQGSRLPLEAQTLPPLPTMPEIDVYHSSAPLPFSPGKAPQAPQEPPPSHHSGKPAATLPPLPKMPGMNMVASSASPQVTLGANDVSRLDDPGAPPRKAVWPTTSPEVLSMVEHSPSASSAVVITSPDQQMRDKLAARRDKLEGSADEEEAPAATSAADVLPAVQPASRSLARLPPELQEDHQQAASFDRPGETSSPPLSPPHTSAESVVSLQDEISDPQRPKLVQQSAEIFSIATPAATPRAPAEVSIATSSGTPRAFAEQGPASFPEEIGSGIEDATTHQRPSSQPQVVIGSIGSASHERLRPASQPNTSQYGATQAVAAAANSEVSSEVPERPVPVSSWGFAEESALIEDRQEDMSEVSPHTPSIGVLTGAPPPASAAAAVLLDAEVLEPPQPEVPATAAAARTPSLLVPAPIQLSEPKLSDIPAAVVKEASGVGKEPGGPLEDFALVDDPQEAAQPPPSSQQSSGSGGSAGSPPPPPPPSPLS